MQIIGFFRLVKCITSNAAVENWLLRRRGVSQKDGERSVRERKTKVANCLPKGEGKRAKEEVRKKRRKM